MGQTKNIFEIFFFSILFHHFVIKTEHPAAVDQNITSTQEGPVPLSEPVSPNFTSGGPNTPPGT